MKLRAEKDPGSTWNRQVKSTSGVDRFVTAKNDGNADEEASSSVEKKQDASGPYHSVLVEERVWTANWINQYVFSLILESRLSIRLDCWLMIHI